MRDGWRDGSAVRARHPAGTCSVCAATLPSARAAYCSPACKQRAYRQRQFERALPPVPRRPAAHRRTAATVAHTLYECSLCDTRYLGQRRCPDCHRFCRALGPGGACPHCDEPVLLAELLGTAGLLERR